MEPRLKRNVPALTPQECHLLKEKRVAVIGAGGLGGHLIDQLARIGIGTIRVVDGDIFSVTNLNRQLLATTYQLGKSKAQAARTHIAAIDPAIVCEMHDTFLTADNAAALLDGADLVFDALDSIDARRLLAEAASAAGIPYVYGAIRGWVAQAALILPGQPLLDVLYPANVRLTDKSVLAFTPALCAALQTSLGIRLLTGRPVDAGVLTCVDLLHQDWATIPLL